MHPFAKTWMLLTEWCFVKVLAWPGQQVGGLLSEGSDHN